METQPIKQFLDTIAHTIHIDRSFQRKSCWTNTSCVDFIRSANLKRAPYPIVVADITTGLKISREYGDEYGTSSYEMAHRMGKRYISLDGQNRVNAFTRLFSNDLALYGRFVDADSKIVEVPKNTLYSQLPKRLQDSLRDITIKMEIMHGCRYGDLHEIFVQINSGDALNGQEKRNAINTPISKIIREAAERPLISEMWMKINSFNKLKIARSQDAEWALKSYLYVLDGYSGTFGAGDLNNFYKLGKGKQRRSIPQYSRESCDRFNVILNNVQQTINMQKTHYAAVPIKQYWACIAVNEYCYDNNLEIQDHAKLYNLIYDTDARLHAASKKLQASQIEEWEATKKDGEVKSPYNDSQYYWWWQGAVTNFNIRKSRARDLIAALEKSSDFKSIFESPVLQSAAK